MNKLDQFWTKFLASQPEDVDLPESAYPAWYFGDGPALAQELAALVLAGKKEATCTLLAEFEHEGEPLPKAGERAIVTDYHGEPLGIIETTGVEILVFNQVGADFAFAEGEGDRTLESWRQDHSRYFRRRCRELGLKFSPDMPVVCERFRLVYCP